MDNIDSAIQLLQQQGRSPPPQGQSPDPIAGAMNMLQGQQPAPTQRLQLTPEQQKQAAVKDLYARPFGSGVANAAYNLGGNVTDIASKVLPPGGAAAAGYAANVIPQAGAALFGGNVGKAVQAPVENTARWLMGTALKPNTKEWLSGKADRAINTMLEEGYNASKGGVLAMRKKIGELGDQIESITSSSGKEIDKQAVIDRLLGTYDKYLLGGAPSENAASIGNVARSFSERAGLAGHETIPIPLAQQIKQTMGRELGDPAYGAGLKPAAERDAQKALVRALKEDISSAEPTVAPLNAKESALINAAKIAERRAGTQGNANPFGLALVAPTTAKTIGFLADKWGLTKSAAARLLFSEAKGLPSAGFAGGALVGGSTGQASTQQQLLAEQLRRNQ